MERRRLLSLLDDEKEEDLQREMARVKRLQEVAMNGSVPSLLELLREEPHILHKINPSLSDTPLHIASLLGHSAFVKELLSRNPELAGESNSQGSSPLHVAAAKGYVEIVKELILVNPDMCLALDHGGRSPLHLGAIKGRVGVLTEMVRVRSGATRVLTSGGESALLLCVKYNRLEALKVLVESVGRDYEFVNWRDSDGNTVLHIAVAKKQLEIVGYLLTSTAIEVNAQNANGFTALDVLSRSPRDLRDMEIKGSLQKAGASIIREAQYTTSDQEIGYLFPNTAIQNANGLAALDFLSHSPRELRDMGNKRSLQKAETSRMSEAQSITSDQEIVKTSPIIRPLASQKSSSKQPVKQHKHTDWLGRKRSALMVVAILIATVAFQSALSPPGGVWQDDYLVDSNGNPVPNPHKVGLAVLAYTLPKSYGQFMIINTIAFLASLSIILLLISGLPMRQRRWMWIQMVIMWSAITAQTGTYFVALINTTPKNVEGVLFNITRVSVLLWLVVMGTVFMGNIIRMILWLLRKYGYIKEKETEPTFRVEDDENDDL